MTEPSAAPRKLQWGWIGMSIVLYAVLYLVPLMIFTMRSGPLSFIWLFAGVVIVAALAGFLSKGVTSIEPAIAGAVLIFLFFITMIILIPGQIYILGAVIGRVIIMALVFLLSLLGAWMGERAQKLWRTQSTPETQKQ